MLKRWRLRSARAALCVRPTACIAGTIAYIRGPEVTTATSKTATFQIVRVLVVGILTEAGFRSAVPAAFFSLEKIDERIA